MAIKNFAILGERCSGTNYLEEVIKLNFGLPYTTVYGNKHFFCFTDYSEFSDVDNTLFIGIVRNPIYWLNSLSKELYHVSNNNRQTLKTFLFDEFYSVCNEINVDNQQDNSNFFLIDNKPYVTQYEVNQNDLNYKTGKKYKNVFELRKVKNDYLMKVMPTKVKNYMLINYENLLFNFENTLELIKKNFNLTKQFMFYTNVAKYKKTEDYKFVCQRKITFSDKLIDILWDNLDEVQELLLGYLKYDNNNSFKRKQFNGVMIVRK